MPLPCVPCLPIPASEPQPLKSLLRRAEGMQCLAYYSALVMLRASMSTDTTVPFRKAYQMHIRNQNRNYSHPSANPCVVRRRMMLNPLIGTSQFIVLVSRRDGVFRSTLSLAKFPVDARKNVGAPHFPGFMFV